MHCRACRACHAREVSLPLGRCVVPFQCNDSASSVVKRSLRAATTELVALLSEARALGLVDELNGTERRLLAALAAAPAAGARSSAMSRASSYDSFFDGDAAKFVFSTPGDTQPSTPRASLTPTGWPNGMPNGMPNDRYVRYVLPDWLEEANGQSLAEFSAAEGQLGVFEQDKQREGDLQLPPTWQLDAASSSNLAMASAASLVLQRAPLGRKLQGRSVEDMAAAWATEDPPELRPIAAASSISRHKWQQNSIPNGIGGVCIGDASRQAG